MFEKFLLFMCLYHPVVFGDIQSSKPGIVLSWQPQGDELIVDFYKQQEHQEETPKPVSFEITTTKPNFIVNCQVYQWRWIWNPKAHYEYIYRVDLLTSDGKVRYESLITNSCDQDDVTMSIMHSKNTHENGLKKNLKTVFMAFMDQAGNCYERSYIIDSNLDNTITVTRSTMNPIDCPTDMKSQLAKRINDGSNEKLKKGIVMDWAPVGKELIAEYKTDSVVEETVFKRLYSFNKFKIECKKITISGGNLYLATVTFMGQSPFVLERLGLKSCDENTFNKTFSVTTNYVHYIDFIASDGICYRRTYEMEYFNRNNYKYTRLIRTSPKEIECQKSFPDYVK